MYMYMYIYVYIYIYYVYNYIYIYTLRPNKTYGNFNGTLFLNRWISGFSQNFGQLLWFDTRISNLQRILQKGLDPWLKRSPFILARAPSCEWTCLFRKRKIGGTDHVTMSPTVSKMICVRNPNRARLLANMYMWLSGLERSFRSPRDVQCWWWS